METILAMENALLLHVAEEKTGNSEKEPENGQNGQASCQYGHEKTVLMAIGEADPYRDGSQERNIGG